MSFEKYVIIMPKVDPFKTADGRPISNAIEQWGDLSDRDFVVLECSVLDANLTYLLQQRLANLPKISENFLGIGDRIEGSGASTLSSKAELAALVGLLSPDHVRYLKAFMRIRNHFAHRVVMDFMNTDVVKELGVLKGLIELVVKKEWKSDPRPGVRRLYKQNIDKGIMRLGKTNQAGRYVLGFSRVLLEAHFWQIEANIERVKTLKFLPPIEYEV